jgi:hypothetical protein
MNYIDATSIANGLNDTGYAIAPKVLSEKECDILISEYSNASLYRKTVIMDRLPSGMGEHKYFNYPLPDVVHQLRTAIYPVLAPLANNWMRILDIDSTFPDTHASFLEHCHIQFQYKPTPLISRYEKRGYKTLHRDLYGEVFFPIQGVVLLSDAVRDYLGGEFVLLEQGPGAKSRVIVLKPNLGDLLLFATSLRPAHCSVGCRRLNVRHGVSEVTRGQLYTLNIIFHDAK